MKNYFFFERGDGLSLRQFERIGNKPLVMSLLPPLEMQIHGHLLNESCMAHGMGCEFEI